MKNTIIAIIVGLCVAVTTFTVLQAFLLKAQTNKNTQDIAEIVNFIRANTQAQ